MQSEVEPAGRRRTGHPAVAPVARRPRAARGGGSTSAAIAGRSAIPAGVAGDPGDLRVYGLSALPDVRPDHAPHSAGRSVRARAAAAEIRRVREFQGGADRQHCSGTSSSTRSCSPSPRSASRCSSASGRPAHAPGQRLGPYRRHDLARVRVGGADDRRHAGLRMAVRLRLRRRQLRHRQAAGREFREPRLVLDAAAGLVRDRFARAVGRDPLPRAHHLCRPDPGAAGTGRGRDDRWCERCPGACATC